MIQVRSAAGGALRPSALERIAKAPDDALGRIGQRAVQIDHEDASMGHVRQRRFP